MSPCFDLQGIGDKVGGVVWEFSPDAVNGRIVESVAHLQPDSAYAALDTSDADGSHKQHAFYMWKGAEAFEGIDDAAEQLSMALGMKLGTSVARHDERPGQETAAFKKVLQSSQQTATTTMDPSEAAVHQLITRCFDSVLNPRAATIAPSSIDPSPAVGTAPDPHIDKPSPTATPLPAPTAHSNNGSSPIVPNGEAHVAVASLLHGASESGPAADTPPADSGDASSPPSSTSGAASSADAAASSSPVAATPPPARVSKDRHSAWENGHVPVAGSAPDGFNPSGDEVLHRGNVGSVQNVAHELAKKVQEATSVPAGLPKHTTPATKPSASFRASPAPSWDGAPPVTSTPTVKSRTATPRSSVSNLPLSEHDKSNTANVSLLLKMGSFRLQPLQDFIPYEELVSKRVEDGIDVTRKEDYLDDADFRRVFGLDRSAYIALPAWKKQIAKKKVHLF